MKIPFFKKTNNFKRKSSGINPNFYWELMVFITFVLIILSFLFGYHLFNQINQETAVPAVGDSNQVGTVNTARIKEVLNYFSLREQKSTQILNSPAPVVDPSL